MVLLHLKLSKFTFRKEKEKLNGYSQNLSKCILLMIRATKIRIRREYSPPKRSGSNNNKNLIVTEALWNVYFAGS